MTGAARPERVRRLGGWPRRLLRYGVPAAVLVALLAELGAGPFLRAFPLVSTPAVAAALALVFATTLCSAGRWVWVARRLELDLDLRTAVGAYYRSQLLNQVLPGGIVGDVHRALRHGDAHASLGPAARAVAWERTLGQAGLVALALAVVVVAPAALPPGFAGAIGLVLLVVVLLALVLAVPGLPLGGRLGPLVGRMRAVAAADLRRLAGRPGPWLPLGLSVAAASGHLLVLTVAARAAGAAAPLRELVPLLVVVLAASSLPSIAGWGPREGAAAWVFGAAGLGAADGVTVATLYGVLSLLAVAPGAALLAHDLRPLPAEVTQP